MTIYFYKELGPLGYLASYSLHGFWKEGVYWKTVEHYYQAHKFEDIVVRAEIIDAQTPKDASSIGRNRSHALRKGWKHIKVCAMYDAVLYKFLQNQDIADKLLQTGTEWIVEATVKENYWGCGPNKDGANHYGIILCQVRDTLRKRKAGGKTDMYYMTREGYEKLQKDYMEIDQELIELNKKMGESVKRDNDLRENQEFMQLRVQAMYDLPAKKKSMAEKCNNVCVIEDMDEYKNFDGKTAIIGSKVKLDFDGDICEYTILGTDEGNIDEDILSCDAPIAKALLGKEIGDEVLFNDETIRILDVKRVDAPNF